MKGERARDAISQELSARLATREASKAVAVHGLTPSHGSEQDDGEQACAQASLGGIKG